MLRILLPLIVTLILSGCATKPPRAEYTNLTSLEKGWSRIFITAGQIKMDLSVWSDMDLRFKSDMGPVYINGQKVGFTAHKEHFAVDLIPGNYEAYCESETKDVKIYSIKKKVILKAGDIRYFTCDKRVSEAVVHGGLLGALSSEVHAYRYLAEKPSLDKNNRLVSYTKYLNPNNAPTNMPENDSILHDFPDMQSLRRDGAITEDQFQRFRKKEDPKRPDFR
jgi:uncharacterized protein YceK